MPSVVLKVWNAIVWNSKLSAMCGSMAARTASASTNTQPLIVEVTLELSTSGGTSSNDLFLAAPSLLQKVCKEF